MRAAFGIAILIAVFAGAVEAVAQNIRVRLLDLNEPVTITLSAHERPMRLYAGDHDSPLTELAPGHQARVTRASGQLHVVVDGMGLYTQSLRAEPDEDGLVGIRIEEGAVKQELRRYAGKLLVSADGDAWEMTLVNDVPLEEYVASVVASEYGFDDLEGSKAMAVLVRTYALGVLGRFGPEYDHVDHTLSQVYRGSDAITPISLEAAKATAGEVLTYDGALIRAVYFASSGGHTADNEAVWSGRPLPYLRGKPDPYGRQSPHASWSTRISRPRLLAELRTIYDQAVDGFVINDRSEDGRVATVDLILSDGSRQSISGNDFRLIATEIFGVHSVRSTLFDARREGDEYVFDGRGFGHGVGLSQWGAHDMARNGKQYAEILDFYYAGVDLARMDDPRRAPSPDPIRLAGTDTDSDPLPARPQPSETDAPSPDVTDEQDDAGVRTQAESDATPATAESGSEPQVEDRSASDVDSEPVRQRRIGW